MTVDKEWWRDAVLYQIYPRSFADGNNDGTGDLKGIAEKLDYVAKLNVDGIWISPFYKSPMADFGYDISDYTAVDPIFGNLDDFRAVTKRANELGLKVIVDQVLCHTSDQHAWFQASRLDRTNEYADWYVWADPKEDGTPPNNWQSCMGGSAWAYEAKRKQYYWHPFHKKQPALNWHNPKVEEAMFKMMRFWLDLGVDGFRLDAINFLHCDPQLRDNPTRKPQASDWMDSPYFYQQHPYDKNGADTPRVLSQIRAFEKDFPAFLTIGEISDFDELQRMADYTKGTTRLHSAYSFKLLESHFSPSFFGDVINQAHVLLAESWPCWSFSNHDVPRSLTRLGTADGLHLDQHKDFPKLVLAVLAAFRGIYCVYEGEELGLPNADIEYEDLQDPMGKEFWPEYKGRDGCRTPIPWTADGPFAGFSKVKPWLPVPDSHHARAVSIAAADPSSPLHFFADFFKWRKTQDAMRYGDAKTIAAQTTALILAVRKSTPAQTLLLYYNLSEKPQSVKVDGAAKTVYSLNATLKDGTLELGVCGFAALQ